MADTTSPLAQVLAALQAAEAQISALIASQGQFTQADVDAAVAAAIGPLNDQITGLQTQVAGIPDQIHLAVAAEDVAVAVAIKPDVDKLVADILALQPAPAPAPVPAA